MAKDLQNLPRRLMREQLVVEVWEGRLSIDNHSYPMLGEAEQLLLEPVTCDCVGEDPAKADEVIRQAATTDTLVDESHYIAKILRCDRCGQQFLRLSYEMIDWNDGDDSQSWVSMIITQQQAEQLRAIAGPAFERDLSAMELEGRQLVASYPCGGGSSRQWKTGRLSWFRHD